MEKDVRLIKKLILYEPETGKLFWKVRVKEDFPKTRPRILLSWNKKYAGKEAFTAVGTHGYYTGAILGKLYLAHRIIWLLCHNEWPHYLIDHIDGNRLNNSIGNLRVVSYEESSRNVGKRSDNTSGVTGVNRTQSNKWFSRIVHEGKKIHLGTFESFEEAVLKRKEAEVKYGYHKNHGRVVR